jgi:hypothetical protein
MSNSIFIDPSINTHTDEMVTVIVQFITKPAHEAVAIAKKSGVPLTLENANWAVEHSHNRFEQDIKKHLALNKVPYRINHIYKTTLNGVSLSLPGKEIKRLLHFKEVASIHANKEYHIDPPIQPNYS